MALAPLAKYLQHESGKYHSSESRVLAKFGQSAGKKSITPSPMTLAPLAKYLQVHHVARNYCQSTSKIAGIESGYLQPKDP